MILFSANCICPYCYQKNDKKRMNMVCTNNRCKEYNKEVLATGNSKCPECGAKMKKLCIHCNQPMEDIMLETKEKDMFPLAMIGLKNSGKSNYVAVAIRELQSQANKLGLNTMAMNQDTSNRYRTDFYSYVYNQHLVVPQTIAMTGKGETQKPLIYKIMISNDKKKLKSNFLLSFYDTAGENFAISDEDTEVHASYISYAQGIILLVDPWQIPGVKAKMAEKGLSVPDVGISCRDMIERVIRTIRKGRHCNDNQKIDIPIAVVFSKVDSFMEYGLVSEDSCLCRDSLHLEAKCYLKSEHDDTNVQMKDFLVRWTEGTDSEGLVPLIETTFTDCAFFGVSAFSDGVDRYGKINCPENKIHSMRVLDPFLWLLYKNGLIKMKG